MGIIMRFRIIISTLLLITIGANQAWSDVDIKVQTQQYIQKGKDYYHQHKYKEAVDEYLKAYKLDPSNPELWELLGYSELKQGHIQNAVGDLEQSIERDPNFVMGHYNLALAYWAQGRKEDAVQQMQKVVDLNLN